MALPVNRPHNEAYLSAYLADVSADSSAFVASPVKGRLVRVYSVIYNAITGADCTWSVKVAGTSVTGSTVTITQSGSAAGDVDSLDISGDVRVNEGDKIEFDSAGESSTTCPTMFYAVIAMG